MFHCDQFGFMVVFGTGQYLGDADLGDTSSQSVYGIWDYSMNEDKGEYLGSFDRTTGALSKQPSGVTLLEQEVIDYQTDSDGTRWRTLSDNEGIWTTAADIINDQDGSALPSGTQQYENPAVDTLNNSEAHAGWYFDLPQSGERVITDVRIWDGKAIVVSYTPSSSSMCSAGGSSFLHELNACSGGRLSTPSLDFDGDGDIDEDDTVTIDGVGDVVATGVELQGIIFSPMIVLTDVPTVEALITNDNGGEDPTSINQKANMVGRTYWMDN
jgi:type IV pilus assembly protein PilY1